MQTHDPVNHHHPEHPVAGPSEHAHTHTQLDAQQLTDTSDSSVSPSPHLQHAQAGPSSHQPALRKTYQGAVDMSGLNRDEVAFVRCFAESLQPKIVMLVRTCLHAHHQITSR